MSYRARPKDLLARILAEVEVLREIGSTIARDVLLSHAIYQRAAVRSLEVIGKATKRLDDAFRQGHPGIPWRDMARPRDRLIHDYEGVNYLIVWDVIATEIPKLAEQLGIVLDSLRAE